MFFLIIWWKDHSWQILQEGQQACYGPSPWYTLIPHSRLKGKVISFHLFIIQLEKTITPGAQLTPLKPHNFSVFICGHRCIWRHDISRSDQSQHCLHAVSAKHSVCLHVSRVVSRLWPSDVPSRIYFSPVGLIWLYFIRLWISRMTWASAQALCHNCLSSFRLPRTSLFIIFF